MTTQNDRQRQAEDAFNIHGDRDAKESFVCGVQWADSTPPPQEGDEEAWERVRENFLPSYQTSNGKLIFMYGIAHARRTQNAEVERLKEDVKKYSEMSLQYMSQIQELRTLLEKFDAFTEHCLNREDFAPGGSQEGWAKRLRSDYQRTKGGAG